MALSKRNIIIGAARVYLGPSTPTSAGFANSKPAYVAGTKYATTLAGADGSTATGVGTLVTNWLEIGYTQEGLEVATDPSWSDVEVDQLLDAAKIFKDGMTLNISTTFAEATLENLLIAWGQQAASLVGSGSTAHGTLNAGEREANIEGGNLGEAPLERGLIAVGNATENVGGNTYGERVYQAYRVLSVEATSFTASRSEALVIPVTFRALPADNGRYGAVRDRLNVT